MAPSGLVVDSVIGNLVTLRWKIPSFGPAPTDIAFEGGTRPGEVLASLFTGSTAPALTFTAPAGSFYLRVHALNGAFRSAASNEVQLHVDQPMTRSAPANLLGLVNGSELALAWTITYEGGTPTSLVLDVTCSINTSLSMAVVDSFPLAGVPAGTYTLALRAVTPSSLSMMKSEDQRQRR
jgi:hypothetical protein